MVHCIEGQEQMKGFILMLFDKSPTFFTKEFRRKSFNILKFIYRQNTLGVKPSYSAVGKELAISKPTVRKRIGDLIATGYVREDIKGRNKAVELTERGRQLFWK